MPERSDDVLARYGRFCMAEKQKAATTEKREPLAERDQQVKIVLDPEVALRALLKVDPDAPPVDPEPGKSKRSEG